MLFLLLLLISPQTGEALIGTVTAVLGFGYTAYSYFNDAHDAYNKWKKQITLDNVLEAVTSLSSKINEMESRLESKLDNLFEKLITQLPRLGQRARAMEELSNIIEEIDYLYEFFEFSVINTAEHVNNRSMEKFIETVTSLDPGHLLSLLNRIHGLVAPKRTAILRDSLLELIDEESKGSNHDSKACGNEVDRPTLISEIYTTLVVTEIRGMMMIGFSYTMLELLHNDSYISELNFATKKLKDRCDDYLDTFTNAHYPPSEIRNCDPPGGWVKGESYYEFERFRTLYVLSEEGFNDPPSCKKPYDSNDVQISCEASLLCTPENKCRGHLIECIHESYAWICPVRDSNSSRRYWDVTPRRGRWTGLGNEKNCQFDTNQFLKTHADANNDFCDPLYCDCIEDSYDSNSMRTLSYREQMSDVKDNRIITGVKFVNAQRMIHIQIQHGRIIAQGNVDPNSVEWKPLEDILYNETETLEKKALTYYIKHDNGTKELLQEGEDFGSFSVDEDMIDLDDIKVSKDYVITDDIKFTWDWDSERKARWIEVHATAYDYLTGQLILDNPNYPQKWFKPDDMKDVLSAYDKPRKLFEIDHENTRDPSKINGKTEPVAGPNSAVTIHRTGTVLDAGQTTLPFVDNREVIATPPFALGAIGIYLRAVGNNNHGFIALRLTAIDTIATLQL